MDALFKVYYTDGSCLVGHTRADWRAMPWRGVQVLVVKLDLELDGKTRVVWYQDLEYARVFHDVAFYAWFEGDGRPSGVTPDAVLDRFAARTGRGDVRVGDMSLDDLAELDVKIGESTTNAQFQAILERALSDPEIQ